MFMSVKFVGFVYTFVCSVAGEHGRVPSRRQDGGSLGNTGPQTATLQLPYLCCAYAPSAQVQCLTTICVFCVFHLPPVAGQPFFSVSRRLAMGGPLKL